MKVKQVVTVFIFLFSLVAGSQSQTPPEAGTDFPINLKSDFLDIFFAFPSEHLLAPYQYITGAGHADIPVKYFDTEEHRLEVLDYGGTTVDYGNYSMSTTYACNGWGSATPGEFALHPGSKPIGDNCFNSVDFAVWKSPETKSIFVAVAEFVNLETKPQSYLYIYVFRNNTWRGVENMSYVYDKQLPIVLQRKFPLIAKKKHDFRYILPMRGTTIRVAVTWSDTNDYKMPQLLDIAYIKLVKGKWVFQAL